MEVPRYWRHQPQRYRLEGNVCASCEEVHFPPKNVCPDCGAVETQLNVSSANIKIERTIEQKSDTLNPSVRITNPEYHGIPRDPNERDVIPHSQTLKDETLVGVGEIPVRHKEQVIYSASFLPAD